MRSSTFQDSVPKNRCRGKDPSSKTPLWTFLTVFFLTMFLNLGVQGQNLYNTCTGCTSEDVKATTIRFDPPINASCLNSDQNFDAQLYVGLDVTSNTRYGLYIEFYIEVNGALWPSAQNPTRYAYCVKQDLPSGKYEILVGTVPGLPGGASIRLVDVFTGWENQSPNVGNNNGKYFCDKVGFPGSITCTDIDKPRCKTYPFLGETVLLSKPTITVTGPDAACTGSTGNSFSISGTASTAAYEIELYYSFTGAAPYTKVDNFDGSETIPANSPFTVSQTLTAYLVRVKTGEDPCPGLADSHTITASIAATVNAGPDKNYCTSGSPVQLGGEFGGGATSATWSGGGGTFVPNANTPNATYVPSASEINSGSVTLTLTTNDPDGAGPCLPVNDQMTITISKAAITDAGDNQIVCSSSPNVTLAGSVTGGSTTGTWSGGTGTFNPNNTTLNAVYTPSAAEITAGTVTLTLTSGDPAGICDATTDQMTITINKAVVTEAGDNQTVCATSPNVTLAGSVSGGATTGTWSGGTGTFNPNNTTLNAVYTPSAAEITAGTVTLTLTSANPAGPCEATTDQMTITINKAVVTEAGDNQTVCATSPNVTLAGSVSGGATTGTWSGGTGSFNPNANTLNAVYTPSAAEITAGTVTLTLTSANPSGPCDATTDQMTITINKAVVTEAGDNQTVCATSPNVTLAGSVSGGATTGTWSGGTGTFNPNNTTLNAVYTPSAAEITAGTVTLTLTSANPSGPCDATTDQMTITINKAVITEAGPNQTVCAASPAVTLAGSVSGGTTTGEWVGGTGTFNPGRSALNAVYTPSAAEVTAGTVTLTLKSTDPAGPCSFTEDQMTITINANTSADAGPNQTVCADQTVQLAAISTPSTGTWTGGGGSYSPNNTTPNAVYTPSSAEKLAGTVTLTWTTTDPEGPCTFATDNVTITIRPIVVIDAGPNQTVCSSSPAVTLAGSISGGTTTGEWVGGTGTFNPGRSALNATYTPSAAEITAGTVSLTLKSSDPEGPCGFKEDGMTITINPAATADAGPNQTVCANQTVQLAASGSGTWTGGGGTYNPNSSTANAVYTPSAAEKFAGTVTLTWNVSDPDGSGPCVGATDQVTITINPIATVEAGNPQSTCAGVGVTLTAVLGGSATSVTWSAPSGQFLPNANANPVTYVPSGTGAINVTVTTNDPAGPCAAATDVVVVTANTCAAGYCTYTQGGFGNEGGKDSYKKGNQCIKSTGATMTVGDALDGWGANGMQISNMNFKRSNVGDVALIIAYLPNGGPSKPYPGTKANLLKDGDKNTLLAQTMTLGLNMGLNPSLASFVLENKWLVTASSDDCGETPDGMTTQCFKFSVSAGMDKNKDGKVTIGEVFELANLALKGETPPAGVSLSALAGAADAVNNAFDECRVPLRWSDTDACGGARNTLADANTETFGTTANASSAIGKELKVKAYPNPFKDRVFISFTSPVSGKAVVEIFDMTGRRLESINKGQVVAGRENTVEYTVPSTNRNSIIYRVTVDKFSVNGRLVSPGLNR